MNPHAPVFIGLALAVVATSCRSGSNDGTKPANSPPAAEPAADTTQMRLTGTVKAVGIEGGCWRFDSDDGRNFEISKAGVPADLLQDGKKATITVRPRPDLMSTCMIGPIIEVVKVEG